LAGLLCALLVTAGAMTLTGCASVRDRAAVIAEISPFSKAKAGATLPVDWRPLTLSRFKRNTEYKLVVDTNHAGGSTVLQAYADKSASGLVKTLDLDAMEMPWLRWEWKVSKLIAKADNTRRDKEDSPVRIVITFDGDMSKLDFEEQANSSRAKALTGNALPYATLMYIWENKAPIGAVIESQHTTRIKMVVAQSGVTQRDRWIENWRNVAVDFERAFGEKPGRIKSIGVMSDTDNTADTITAYYGDIRFAKEQGTALEPDVGEAAKDKTTNDKATNDKATNDKATNDKATNDKATNDKATNDKAVKNEVTRNEATKEQTK
jgi:Protein of unknown function (DUF3047)